MDGFAWPAGWLDGSCSPVSFVACVSILSLGRWVVSARPESGDVLDVVELRLLRNAELKNILGGMGSLTYSTKAAPSENFVMSDKAI